MSYDDYKLDNPFHEKDAEPDYDAIRQQRQEDAYMKFIMDFHETLSRNLRKKFYETDDRDTRFMLMDIAQEMNCNSVFYEFLDVLNK